MNMYQQKHPPIKQKQTHESTRRPNKTAPSDQNGCEGCNHSSGQRLTNRIIDNFEYAKEHGQFPPKLTYSNLIATGSNITSSFVIKQGNKHEGYYTFGNCRSFKYYMPTKPNFIVRFFMKNLLGFFWVDEK